MIGQVDGHVDWLSWTMRPHSEVRTASDLYANGKRCARELSNEHETILFNGTRLDRASRISNFDLCLARESGDFRLAGGGPTGYILFNLSGRGCDDIREPELSRRFVSQIAPLLTRFDYAVDIPTSVRPSHFVNARSHKGFRTISLIRSDSGETVYVGSRKSDRFARVYRYNDPHPRHALLRVEYVFRRAMARTAAIQYCESEGDDRFQSKLGNTWGWSHSCYNPAEQTDERIEVPVVDRETEQTIFWLYRQVAPALARVMKTGGFDMADFLQCVYNQ